MSTKPNTQELQQWRAELARLLWWFLGAILMWGVITDFQFSWVARIRLPQLPSTFGYLTFTRYLLYTVGLGVIVTNAIRALRHRYRRTATYLWLMVALLLYGYVWHDLTLKYFDYHNRVQFQHGEATLWITLLGIGLLLLFLAHLSLIIRLGRRAYVLYRRRTEEA